MDDGIARVAADAAVGGTAAEVLGAGDVVNARVFSEFEVTGSLGVGVKKGGCAAPVLGGGLNEEEFWDGFRAPQSGEGVAGCAGDGIGLGKWGEGEELGGVEVAAVIDAADTADPRNGAMVYVMARMGLRVGEAMALRRGDVDLGPGILHVRFSMARSGEIGPLKGRDEDEPRSLPTPPDVLARLKTHLEATAAVVHIGGFLFTGVRGGRMRYTNWRNRVWGADQHPKSGTIRDRVGFDVKPHDLRHTAATNLFVRDRWTVPAVQAYLGHRDHKTTLAIYTHVTADQLPTPSSFGVV